MYLITHANPTTGSFTIQKKGDEGGPYLLVVDGEKIGQFSYERMTVFMKEIQGWMTSQEFLQCCEGLTGAADDDILAFSSIDKLESVIAAMKLLFRSYEAIRRHRKVMTFAFALVQG